MDLLHRFVLDLVTTPAEKIADDTHDAPNAEDTRDAPNA
jgi:hypothetical protein